ncbi:hypothetical protein ABT187_26460 [Streptomyces sp. NPDC001817]
MADDGIARAPGAVGGQPAWKSRSTQPLDHAAEQLQALITGAIKP